VSAALRLTDDELDAIADRVVARLAPHLRLVHSVPTVAPLAYTSNKRGPHAPGKSQRWMLDHLCQIPGARKEGRDWVISVADYEAWATSEDLKKCGPRTRKPPTAPVHKATKKLDSTSFDPADLDARAERSLAAAGYRPTK
jgi:hypothetical protein